SRYDISASESAHRATAEVSGRSFFLSERYVLVSTAHLEVNANFLEILPMALLLGPADFSLLFLRGGFTHRRVA
ncbi:hypothetical protein ABTE72_18805, partial [Acinetobacter baumannii]